MRVRLDLNLKISSKINFIHNQDGEKEIKVFCFVELKNYFDNKIYTLGGIEKIYHHKQKSRWREENARFCLLNSKIYGSVVGFLGKVERLKIFWPKKWSFFFFIFSLQINVIITEVNLVVTSASHVHFPTLKARTDVYDKMYIDSNVGEIAFLLFFALSTFLSPSFMPEARCWK